MRIEDVEKPIVGRFYEVPCVRAMGNGAGWQVGQMVPIIGPLHEDAEFINFPAQHFHPDLRFASDATIEHKLTGLHFDHGRDAQRKVFASVLTRYDANLGVVRRRRKCRRLHPTFPIAHWKAALEAVYAGKVAKCRVCPHRGVSIAGAPLRDGKLICPGHGLAFHPETLACVPRGRR